MTADQGLNDNEIPKAYSAKDVEQKWLEFWHDNNLFKASAASEKPSYTVSIPPPNVTGSLHMGHALGVTLQDTLVRWKRMLGFEALYVPGTDHAGIATQTAVERHLIKTQGKTRKEFSRDDFLKYVFSWKEEYEARILDQLKKVGASLDFSRLRFTMDEGCSKAVRTIFKKMYDDGLIYRGDYLVNWDPVTQTAIADDEVEYEDRSSFLWHFRYPMEDGSGFVEIATTRPETMLGDVAIAVSPKDERYKSMVGKKALLPFLNRPLPIVVDRRIDPEFGTGMVKITPAHDPNDYQIGLDLNLPMINIMTPDGRINENGGAFQGMTMAEARAAIIQEMKALNLLIKEEPHNHRVGVSYRSKAVIEPYLSKQWFVRMSGFKDELRKAVESKEVKLIPDNWANTYFHWIDNLRDWCISRQLWWGHRIPVWYHKNDPDRVICFDGEGTPDEVLKAPGDWIQEEDVLDTWFSSGLWPFSILGWPEKTADLKKFYPNSVLITGHDILFFWVARMILMGKYAMNQFPFPEVVLHGLIYGKSYWRNNPDGGITYCKEQERIDFDMGKPLPKEVQSKWEKMSKTKGNVIDPLEIIDLYGTDAMRMALAASATQSREIDLDRRRFEEFKNFANKVWNGARFVFMNLGGENPLTTEEFQKGLDESLLSLEDRWILSTLSRTVAEVNNKLENYLFDQAAMQAYDFFWQEFCSYFVEIAKPVLFGKQGTDKERKNKQKLLAIVLCQSIRLLHPMAPFITEELFQLLKSKIGSGTILPGVDPYTKDALQAMQAPAAAVAPYPTVLRKEDQSKEIDLAFDLVGKVVYSIRNLRGEMQVPPGEETEVHIIGHASDNAMASIQQNSTIIKALVKVKSVNFHAQEPKLSFSSHQTVEGLKIMIPLPQSLIKQEKARLAKEENRLQYQLEKLSKQLSSEEFVSKAPQELVAKQRGDMEKADRDLTEVRRKIAEIDKCLA